METLRSILSEPLFAPPGTSAIDDSAPQSYPPSASALTPVLAGTQGATDTIPELLAAALASRSQRGPLPAGAPSDVLAAVHDALGPIRIPQQGIGERQAIAHLGKLLSGYGIDLAHPRAAAHLQAPPLAIAVAADALASFENASLDTYDSGPAAIAVEQWVVRCLSNLAKLGPQASGVFTPGGSISNLLGLLLARDAAAQRNDTDARYEGVSRLSRPVVFCSEVAHFSIERACAALGMGERAVRKVQTDARHRMLPSHLERTLAELTSDETPVAIVATAGTTDFGSIDPLSEVAAIAARHEVWLHVDAAYGFGALFSERLSTKVSGLELADSITLDLHKLGWQPAATSLVLVRNDSSFSALEREVAYLNPSDDSAAGLDGLLGRSLQTTRRADALKVAATFLACGRSGLGALVERCHDLALHAQRTIFLLRDLELVSTVELTTVVFRYKPQTRAEHRDGERDDWVNAAIRRCLLQEGTALLGRTRARCGIADGERTCLKLTLLNPTARAADVDDLLRQVVDTGRRLDRVAEAAQ